MANEANLKPFRPGQSGNPGGRPRGRSLTARLRDAMDGEARGKRGRRLGRTVEEAIVAKLIEIALGGDRQAIRDVFERLEGRVPDAAADDDDSRPVTYAEFKAALRGHRTRQVQR